MNENSLNNSPEDWKGIKFWIKQIREARIYDKLSHFNDVITEKRPPHSESNYSLVFNDIILDGKKCDIYHTDQDEQGNNKEEHTFHRIFIYIKE